jgi:hypothetical protein
MSVRIARHLSALRSTVAAAALVLALLLTFGIAAPPASAELAEGYYGSNKERAEGSIPSLGGKIMGYAQYLDKNGYPPQNLILGTSRGMMLDPRVVKKLSGRSAFNGSVSDGAARELFALGNFSQLIAPGREPHLVLMFDVEGLDRRTPTKRVESTMKSEAAIRAKCHVASKCGKVWTTGARGIVKDATIGHEGRPALSLLQRPDGMILSPHLARLEREGADFNAIRAHRIQIRVASYQPGGGFDKLMPIPEAVTSDLLKLANGWGDTPTVIITAMHPDCIRICGPAGWSAHHRDALKFFAKLAKTEQFDLHDFSDARSFGGSAASFYEDIHLRPKAAAQVVAKINSFGGWSVDPRADKASTATDTAAGVAAALKGDTVSSDTSTKPKVDPSVAKALKVSARTRIANASKATFLERSINELADMVRGI